MRHNAKAQMADLKDKEYSLQQENLLNFGKGADLHKDDTEKPIPTNMRKPRYVDAAKTVEDAWDAMKDARTALNLASKAYQTKYAAAEKIYSGDARIIKGIYDPTSQTLRDYGVQPEKPKTGVKKPKKPTP